MKKFIYLIFFAFILFSISISASFENISYETPEGWFSYLHEKSNCIRFYSENDSYIGLSEYDAESDFEEIGAEYDIALPNSFFVDSLSAAQDMINETGIYNIDITVDESDIETTKINGIEYFFYKKVIAYPVSCSFYIPKQTHNHMMYSIIFMGYEDDYLDFFNFMKSLSLPPSNMLEINDPVPQTQPTQEDTSSNVSNILYSPAFLQKVEIFVWAVLIIIVLVLVFNYFTSKNKSKIKNKKCPVCGRKCYEHETECICGWNFDENVFNQKEFNIKAIKDDHIGFQILVVGSISTFLCILLFDKSPVDIGVIQYSIIALIVSIPTRLIFNYAAQKRYLKKINRK